VHEMAHEWCYALVGNSQESHPWLDEAFASWAEGTVDGIRVDETVLRLPDDVGDSTAEFDGDERRYYTTVYGKGAAALQAAERAVGTTAFRKAIRCYVNANAWQVAHPADVAAALSGLPKATAVLREAGALP
jgi:aminopeptidase N